MKDETKNYHGLIKTAGFRIARLAALNAPVVCYVTELVTMHRRVKRLCEIEGIDFDELSQGLVRQLAAPSEDLTPGEIAEMERDDKGYAAAEEKARKKYEGTDNDWNRLDRDIRFDLIMAEWKDPSDA